ncbi:MAG: tetratricopeptide repeat-containing serine protease family protein [Pseudomonadota bacterium]
MRASAGIPFGTQILAAMILLLSQVIFAAAHPPPADDPFTLGWQAFEAGDYSRALSLWLPLAEQGDMYAQNNLGFLYEYGQGTGLDEQQAAHWYRQSARNGLAVAQFNLALMYANGVGSRQDPLRAAYWFRQAAEQGLADAQYQLAELLQQYMGVPRSSTAVLDWLTRAAEQGQLEAMTALAAMSDAVALASVAHTSEGADSRDHLSSFSTGTAWPVASGYAVTNNHVVAGVENVQLIDVTGTQMTASVVLRNAEHDLALLHVSESGSLPPALPLASTDPRPGSRVFTIGYPRINIMGRTPKLSDGIISSLSGYRDDPDSYQISIPIQPGNSGGPLLNMDGAVVGVVAFMLGAYDDDAEPQVLPNVSYAIKVEVLRSMLPQALRQTAAAEQLPAAPAPLADLAERIQGSVLIVMVAD